MSAVGFEKDYSNLLPGEKMNVHLFVKAQGGDHLAFCSLQSLNFVNSVGVAANILDSPLRDQAPEAANEGWSQLWQHKNAVEDPTNWKGYLNVTLRRDCIRRNLKAYGDIVANAVSTSEPELVPLVGPGMTPLEYVLQQADLQNAYKLLVEQQEDVHTKSPRERKVIIELMALHLSDADDLGDLVDSIHEQTGKSKQNIYVQRKLIVKAAATELKLIYITPDTWPAAMFAWKQFYHQLCVQGRNCWPCSNMT